MRRRDCDGDQSHPKRTIVFHSRHDNAVPFEQGRLVAASIPNAKFVPLESNHHVLLPHESAFAQIMDGVKEFLANGSRR